MMRKSSFSGYDDTTVTRISSGTPQPSVALSEAPDNCGRVQRRLARAAPEHTQFQPVAKLIRPFNCLLRLLFNNLLVGTTNDIHLLLWHVLNNFNHLVNPNCLADKVELLLPLTLWQKAYGSSEATYITNLRKRKPWYITLRRQWDIRFHVLDVPDDRPLEGNTVHSLAFVVRCAKT